MSTLFLKTIQLYNFNDFTKTDWDGTRRVDSRGGRGGPDPPKDRHWGGPKSKGPPQ